MINENNSDNLGDSVISGAVNKTFKVHSVNVKTQGFSAD